MSKYWLVLMIVILLAAGCGDETTATPEVPTLDPTLPTSTPRATSGPLPPTWTPQPTVTQRAARPTAEVTRDRPTATMVILPSYTPSDEPPTAAPAGPTLTITADMLNQAVYTALIGGAGGLYEVPPTITLQEGTLLISFRLLNTPSDISSAIPIQIEATPYIVDGRIEVVKERAYRSDTNVEMGNEVIDNVIMTVETELTKLVQQLFQAADPQHTNFFVSELLVTPTEMTIQTVSM